MYIEDCRRLEITVLPPDVNHSGVEFEVEDGAIRFGLGAIKGCGRAVIEGMVAARESGGPFTDLFDFCERVQDSAAMNKSAVECLIKVGAFSSITAEPRPASGDAAGRDERRRGEAQGPEKRPGGAVRRGLRCGLLAPRHAPGTTTSVSSAEDEILAMEKDLVGLYLSGHPLESSAAGRSSALHRQRAATSATWKTIRSA